MYSCFDAARRIAVNLFFPLLLLAVVGGCAETNGTNSSDNHDHGRDHEHADHVHNVVPADFASALSKLKEQREVVRTAFANNSPAECDDALHVAAEILEKLHDLAKQAGMNEESLKKVSEQSASLFKLYASIHEGFHDDGEGTPYDDVADQMDSAMEVLSQLE